MISLRLSVGRALCAAALVLAASGCSGLSAMQNGDPTTMSERSINLHARFVVTPIPITRPLVYSPQAQCTYRTVNFSMEGVERRQDYTVSVRQVLDRLLVTMNDGTENSTALIDSTGHMYDFNLVDPIDRERTTSETYDQSARATAAKIDRPYAHAINPIVLMVPEYLVQRPAPGDVVATILDEGGNLYASFVYRGMTRHGDTEAVMLDLMRVLESMPQEGPITVGYNVVDLNTMLPLVVILDSGTRRHTHRLSCP